MSDHTMFFPLRRGSEIVVFANEERKADRRLNWLAVARCTPGGPVESTRRMRLDAAAMARIEQAVAALGTGPQPDLHDTEAHARLAQGPEGILGLCAQLDLLRKYAVDGEIIRRYEAGAPAQRCDIIASQSIYRLLIDRHEPARGADLVEADLPHADPGRAQARESAQYFRTAAGLLASAGRFAAAEAAMQQAIALQPTEDKYRLLGDYRFELGRAEDAIAAFLQADQIRPLAGPGAFRLGKLLFEAERGPEAAPYLMAAGDAFADPAGRMLARIEAGAAQQAADVS